ncbi:MAG: glycosyltransferase family 2 protein, partial [Planctomycetales bacterium]|nr:glycosyltransferase family 2 protein [Planctomycetales bacterium]
MSLYQFSHVCLWCLVAMAAFKTAWTAVMLTVLRPRRGPRVPDEQLPKAAVLLCLRGADPSLADCLERLIVQDYPNFQIFIAVDSTSDPAWDVACAVVERTGAANVRVAPLRRRLKTCSLKCSSLVQLLDEVDESFEAIVLADADLESHTTWLRELVEPLADPNVGAAFGNRWFLPNQGLVGSLVRQVCNGPGVVVMHAVEIPWGGSLAIRADVLRAGRLREKWSHSIVDDGPVRTVVKQQGLKLRFVPSLLMANREDCTLPFAYNFLRRQLTWTKTYVAPWWPVMVGYSFVAVAMWTISAVMAMVCAAAGQTAPAWNFAGGAAALGGAVVALWLALDIAARRLVRAHGEPA